MDELCAVAYTSLASRPQSATDLDALLQDAQGFNQAAGVSGVLCYHDGLFIQYFEGPASAVERAYARIRASTRHRDLVELSRHPIDARQFQQWHMAFCQAPETLLQVLANIGWEDNIPVTRSQAEPSKALGEILFRWNRWVAGGQQVARAPLQGSATA